MNIAQRNVIEVTAKHFFKTSKPVIYVKWAQTRDEIHAAQQLRHAVFCDEFGAHLATNDGRDSDEFDLYAKHLIAIDLLTGQVVGTYRVLVPEHARKVGRLYMETEFDLSQMAFTKHDVIELGRSCVAIDYRDGAVLRRMWAALAEFLQSRTERYMIGCVSVKVTDDGTFAAHLCNELRPRLVDDSRLRVIPLDPMPSKASSRSFNAVIPALMRSYIKLGAKLMGPPFYDQRFQCADFPMLIETSTFEAKLSRSQRRIAA